MGADETPGELLPLLGCQLCGLCFPSRSAQIWRKRHANDVCGCSVAAVSGLFLEAGMVFSSGISLKER